MSKKDKKKSKYDIGSIALATTILNLIIAAIELVGKIIDAFD